MTSPISTFTVGFRCLLLAVIGILLPGCADPRCHNSDQLLFRPFNASLRHVTSPGTWQQLDSLCQSQHYGYNLLQQEYVSLSAADKAGCSEGVIPLGLFQQDGALYWNNTYITKWETVSGVHLVNNQPSGIIKPVAADLKKQVGALNLTSSTWRLVDDDTTFTCAICQRLSRNSASIARTYHPRPPPEYISPSSVYLATITRLENTSDIEEGGLETEHKLAEDFQSIFKEKLINVSLVSNLSDTKNKTDVYIKISGNNLAIKYADHIGKAINDEYNLTNLERLEFCPKSRTIDWNGIDQSWDGRINTVKHKYQQKSKLISSTRECYYAWADPLGKAFWTEVIFWEELRTRCDTELKSKNNMNDTETLRTFVVSQKKMSTSDLAKVADTANKEVKVIDMVHQSNFHKIVSEIFNPLEKIMGNVLLSKKQPDFHVSKTQFSLIISNLEMSPSPLIGFIMPSVKHNKTKSLKVKFLPEMVEKETYKAWDLIFRLTPLATTNSRLSLGVVVPHEKHAFYKTNIFHYLYMQIILSNKKENIDLNHTDDVYFDIHINQNENLNIWGRDNIGMGGVSLWNSSVGKWNYKPCTTLKLTGDTKDGFRCKHLRKEHDTLSDIYSIYFIENFCDFLKSNVVLLIILLLLSLIGLLSISLTALVTRKWRQDRSNKILLQMTAALFLNLLIGFLVHYNETEADSTACMRFSVLRHYSYLAMFCWMFVLSALQLQRMRVDCVDTPYLLLKVSGFAWGLPILIILFTLLWDDKLYWPEASNQTSCYSERIIFNVAVQAPAAIVLLVNFVIFVLIISRVLMWFGWGETPLKRHLVSKGVKFLFIVRQSCFFFFLFGLHWIFYFILEEIYEYAFFLEYFFLLTVSFHVFILSVYFVFLHSCTKRDWVESFLQLRDGINILLCCTVNKTVAT